MPPAGAYSRKGAAALAAVASSASAQKPPSSGRKKWGQTYAATAAADDAARAVYQDPEAASAFAAQLPPAAYTPRATSGAGRTAAASAGDNFHYGAAPVPVGRAERQAALANNTPEAGNTATRSRWVRPTPSAGSGVDSAPAYATPRRGGPLESRIATNAGEEDPYSTPARQQAPKPKSKSAVTARARPAAAPFDSPNPNVMSPDRTEFQRWKQEVIAQRKQAKRASKQADEDRRNHHDPMSPDADPNMFRRVDGRIEAKEPAPPPGGAEASLFGLPREMWFDGMENFNEQLIRAGPPPERPPPSVRRTGRRGVAPAGPPPASARAAAVTPPEPMSHAAAVIRESPPQRRLAPASSSALDADERMAAEFQLRMYLQETRATPSPPPAAASSSAGSRNHSRAPSPVRTTPTPRDVPSARPVLAQRHASSGAASTARTTTAAAAAAAADPHAEAMAALARPGAAADEPAEAFVPGDYSYENLLRLEFNKHRSGHGLTLFDILKLPKVQLSGHDGDCSVCLEELRSRPAGLRLPCNHLYHGECIAGWFKHHRECPVCRKVVSTTAS